MVVLVVDGVVAAEAEEVNRRDRKEKDCCGQRRPPHDERPLS